MEIISKIFDFISPRFCEACNSKLLESEKFICSECFSYITTLTDEEIESEFRRKFLASKIVKDYTSLFIFEEEGVLQSLIHSLKYNNKFKVGIYLGELLGKSKLDIIKKWNADLIIPIPLFHLKKVKRGFNQADYIAKGISNITQIKTNAHIVKRIKNTKTQTKLNNEERKSNIDGAFRVKNSSRLEGKRIIIVDDVITTGATTLELAKTIKEAGANELFCLSVATPPFSHSVGSSNA